MQLPPELLDNVLRYLPKKDLKMVRRASNQLAELAAPLLFNQVILAATVKDLENAKLICLKFGAFIKTVIVSSADRYYPRSLIRRKDYMNRVKCRYARHHQESSNEAVVGESYENHRRLCEASQEIFEEGEIYLRLCQVLNSAQNARSMVFTYGYLNSRIRASCEKGCLIVDPETEDDEEMSQIRRFYMDRVGASDFHRIFLSLATANCRIKELIVDPKIFLTPEAFTLSARQLSYTDQAMSHLRKLQLNLVNDGAVDNRRIFKDTQISRALSSALNIDSLVINAGFKWREFLEIETLRVGMTMFRVVLGGCSYPKLRTLILQSFDFQEAELLNLLENSRDLMNLVMEDCCMTPSGSWQRLCEAIRQGTSHRSLWIGSCQGGMELGRTPQLAPLKPDNKEEPLFYEAGPHQLSNTEIEHWLRRHRYGRQASCHKLTDQDY